MSDVQYYVFNQKILVFRDSVSIVLRDLVVFCTLGTIPRPTFMYRILEVVNFFRANGVSQTVLSDALSSVSSPSC